MDIHFTELAVGASCADIRKACEMNLFSMAIRIHACLKGLGNVINVDKSLSKQVQSLDVMRFLSLTIRE